MTSTAVLQGHVFLGDEAVAQGAIDAGISAAYGYPGTPSTEILEYLVRQGEAHGHPHTAWCSNEKTALEAALGVSFAGKRSLVTMKHVGLNVAADPFINAAIVGIHGGVVIAVADDPGMHSSQNEQDTRYLADFARVICLEPATQQEAYIMTREAFDLSERFHIPVVIRLVTRLSHSRAMVEAWEPRKENTLSKPPDPASWILLPVNARRQWHKLLEAYREMVEYSEHCPHNTLDLNEQWRELGVITTGIGVNYYNENLDDLDNTPSHVHIGAYPFPIENIRRLVEHVDRVLILEEGYPFVERYLRGVIPPDVEIMGKRSGHINREGELNPDIVRTALGLELPDSPTLENFQVPNRPPQLCKGCPHGDAYGAIKSALADYATPMVTSDIGCYTLGALPPHSAIETCVCMGASIGMAKGASEAGYAPVLAVIGDSTFLHSGVTPLMDAASADTDMTIVILDNETVAMTGTQPTILPSSRLEAIVQAVGVDPQHVHVLASHPKKSEEHTAIIRGEIEHHGLSVIIMVRECLEKARKRKQRERKV
jgi:indolepyruvate ferredoxin oxidoreductase alpha subunit